MKVGVRGSWWLWLVVVVAFSSFYFFMSKKADAFQELKEFNTIYLIENDGVPSLRFKIDNKTLSNAKRQYGSSKNYVITISSNSQSYINHKRRNLYCGEHGCMFTYMLDTNTLEDQYTVSIEMLDGNKLEMHYKKQP
tara:strand:- start:166 stop:576 length:411 start_codon:yes stop_codon:yes gene_type:complete